MEPQTTPATPLAKVFVGNLSFRTTDQELQGLFKDCGEIKAGVVVTRGRRSLGYGFIEFAKLEDAVRSVETINGKDFQGRIVKVELAQDPNERPSFERNRGQQQANSGAVPKAQAPRQSLEFPLNPQPPQRNVQPDSQFPQSQQELGPAKRRRNNRRRRGGNRNSDGPDQVVQQGFPLPPRQPANPPATQNPGTPQQQQPKPPRQPRQPRPPRTPPVQREKILSQTTLFVANLPFSVDEQALKAIFSDLNVKSAHIVQTRSGRSRGYGFVVFENQADQLRALEAKNNQEVKGPIGDARKITVSISSSPQEPAEQHEQPTTQ
jgi:RNA recognition motif-containing protein